MTLKKTLLIGAIGTLSFMTNFANANVINFNTTFTADNFVNSFSYNDGSITLIDTTGLAGSQGWDTSSTLNFTMNNVNNYEFIWEVKNSGNFSAFLADFTLGSNNYLTSTDSSIWSYSADGTTWNSVSSYGQNGGYPWGTRPGIDTAAEWIWDSTNLQFEETLFFKASITSPVPEPSTYALMLGGLGIIGFMAHRRKRQKTS